MWKTTVNPLRKKKQTVPEKRKLRFKDMRRGFAAHEKTHVLRGEVYCIPWRYGILMKIKNYNNAHTSLKTKVCFLFFCFSIFC